MGIGEVRPDDGELIRRARSGDKAAFSRLVRLHQDEVYTLAYRLTGDTHNAADVAQEAFVRAWRSIERFRGDARFSTWLHRITVNVAWTHHARRKRRAADSVDELSVDPPASGPSPETIAVDAAFGATLAEALAELPAGTRTVLVLKDVYDWSHAEIADHLGISVTAAKVRLHRARLRMRDRLAGEVAS